jgi:hypothetical protein
MVKMAAIVEEEVPRADDEAPSAEDEAPGARVVALLPVTKSRVLGLV